MALCLTTVTEGLQKYICSVYLIAYICIFQLGLEMSTWLCAQTSADVVDFLSKGDLK